MRLATVTAVLVVLLGSACSSPSVEQTFADEVCSTTLASVQETLELLDSVRTTRAAPGRDSWAMLAGLSDHGTEITRQFNSDAILISAPDTPGGEKAKAYLLDYSRLSHARLTEEARRVQELPRDLTLVQSIRALNDLETALADVIGFMVSSKDVITQQVSEMEDVFADSASCRELETLGSG
jgi:hypothetical protein